MMFTLYKKLPQQYLYIFNNVTLRNFRTSLSGAGITPLSQVHAFSILLIAIIVSYKSMRMGDLQ